MFSLSLTCVPFQLVATVLYTSTQEHIIDIQELFGNKKGPSFTRSSIWWSMWQRKQLAYLNISFVLENLVPMP